MMTHPKKVWKHSMRIGTAVLMLAVPWAMAQAPAAPAGGGSMRRGAAQPYNYEDNTGFTSMFDGKSLHGWDYDPRFWLVKDGAIYVNPTCEKPTGTVYAIWQGGEASDFILKYELKGTPTINSGVQFRSYRTADQSVGLRYPDRQRPVAPPSNRARAARPPACANPGARPTAEEEAKWNINGPQADFDGNNNYSGMFYEQGGRGIIALPGHVIYSEKGQPIADLGTLADRATLDSWFKKGDYNQFMIVAKGNTVSILMNGHLITEFIDTDPTYFRSGGRIALEVESTGELWARNFYIKKF